MKFKKIISTVLAVSLLAVLLVACASNSSSGSRDSGSSESKGKKSELVMNYRTEPPILDVSLADSTAAFTILGAISEGLYRLDADLQPQPALANELPQISADGLTYTIKLREGIKWADGSPVTADDFVYSFQRTVDPRTKAYYAFMVAWIKGGNDVLSAKDDASIEEAKKNLGVKAIDEKTLEIKLEQPVAFFTAQLAFESFFPQKKEFVDKQGDKSGVDADKVLGCGPFILTSWQHQKSLVLEKNPNYWDAANIKLDKVNLNIVGDNNTGVNLYESGASDFQVLGGDQYVLFKDHKDLVQKKELTTAYINFSQKNVPAFNNKKIRQALSAAIDRKTLVDAFFAGSEAATGYVSTGTLDGNGNDFRKTAGDAQIKFDPARAKQLLQEGMQEAGITEMPKLSIIGDDNGTGPKVLEFLAGQWDKNLGVKVDITPMPHATRLEHEMKLQDYQVTNTLWGADYNDPMTYLDMFLTDGAFNTQHWSNKEYDGLIKAAQIEKDAVKRSEMLVKAEKILLDDGAVLPLYFRTLNILVRDKVQGLVLPAFGTEFELKWASIK